MKTRQFISAAIVMAVGMATGCGRLLDQYPHNAVSSDRLTDEDAELLVNGIYNIAQYKPTFNGYALCDIIGGDLIRPGGSGVNSPVLVVESAIAPNQSIVTSPWNGYYAGMYQINSYISRISGLPESLRKNEMLGTGHFFRGLYYYNMVSRWRSIPIVSVPGENATAAGQATEAEGWKFVEDELKKAAELAADFTDKNRVSRQAAIALLARTSLAMGKKAEAAELAEELIADPHFALADFSSIFRGSDNTEEIFTFANLAEESSVNMGSYYYTKESPVGGSYAFCPTEEAMDMYVHEDLRRTVSVDIQGSNNVLNKYCSGDAGHDPIYIVRLAEMYLISAEGKGLAGGGLERLNALRRFRGLQDVSPSTEDEFIDAILHERRLEFFGEGFRWFDLVRTGRYGEVTGLDEKYTVLPIPARELTLNKSLKQHPLWQSATYDDTSDETDEQ